MRRAPLDLSGGRATATEELSAARELIRRSGLLEALAPHLDAHVGRKRRITLEALFVALQLNAMQRHHHAYLVEAARILNGLTDDQRALLGISSWDPDEAYTRLERLFVKVCRILEDDDDGPDAEECANRLARSAIPMAMLASHSVAVDGTDVESWGALHGSNETVELDGEAVDFQLVDDDVPTPRATRQTRTAKVFSIGSDGRKVYTKDPDARAGHRSATGQRVSGPYIGYELHLAVQIRDVKWTNYVDRTHLTNEVPGVITSCSLVPAGTHRAKAIVDRLLESSDGLQQVKDVVWDPGYSLCQPQTTTNRLGPRGVEQTLQPVTHQRGIRPFAGEALLLDGQLFSPFLPAELRDLPVAPRYARGGLRRSYEEPFNRRARWRYVRHARPDSDGVTRWKCPFCAGLLRSRRLPQTMRRSRRAPLIELPSGVVSCCHGTLSAAPAELPLAQKIPFGTTAWQISMNRRQVVESANAALKGGFTDVGRGYVRVFGLTKLRVLFGFTIAAYNLDRIRSFLAKLEVELRESAKRSKRRLGTWSALLAERRQHEVAHRSGAPPG